MSTEYLKLTDTQQTETESNEHGEVHDTDLGGPSRLEWVYIGLVIKINHETDCKRGLLLINVTLCNFY